MKRKPAVAVMSSLDEQKSCQGERTTTAGEPTTQYCQVVLLTLWAAQCSPYSARVLLSSARPYWAEGWARLPVLLSWVRYLQRMHPWNRCQGARTETGMGVRLRCWIEPRAEQSCYRRAWAEKMERGIRLRR